MTEPRNQGFNMQNVNSLEAKIDAFITNFKPTEKLLAARQEATAKQKEFVKRFPLDSFLSLTPVKYCIGSGSNESFCWWVERGTKVYNYYFPGSSYSYGMYFSKADGAYRKIQQLSSYLKDHPGSTDADALRECVLKPLHAFLVSRGRNLKAIEKVKIGRSYALKLLTLYFPDDFFVMNSEPWLKRILPALGMQSINPFDDNRRLKEFYSHKKEQFPHVDFSQYDLERFLEEELNLKEKDSESKDEDDKSNNQGATMSFLHPLNTILYGPPGTGKTCNTSAYAVAIIEGKTVEAILGEPHDEIRRRFLNYKEQGRIAFTTFHQSYSYEDFIEGIRPVLDKGSENVAYKQYAGIFKDFCNKAKSDLHLSPSAPSDETETDNHPLSKKEFQKQALAMLQRANNVVWKVSLGGSLRESRSKAELENLKKIHNDCFTEGNIRIGWDEYGPKPGADFDYKGNSGGKSEILSFIHEAEIGDIVISLCSDSEIDGIGIIIGEYEWTGRNKLFDEPLYDYYNRVRKVFWLVSGVRINILEANGGRRLVQSSFYKTSIAKPSVEKFVIDEYAKEGESEKPDNLDSKNYELLPYVFIIDEINRGNISKIFGELITLVEPDKRLGAKEEAKAVLPYSGEEFGVPPNVYILGTMNTADRSIALLDTALRRRFNFVEMMPEPRLLKTINVANTGIDLAKMLQTMNDRIEFLLDREHTIGHAYFLGDFKEHPTLAGLADIFHCRIIPLLQEYFFDDYAKIRLVLGDNNKPPAVQFFTEKASDGVFFGNVDDAIDSERKIFRLNDAAFGNPDAYRMIYATASQR